MYTIHIQYALLPNATLPLISLRQNDKKNKLCALNFSLSFMTFIKNNGFYMKILWYILKFPEISGELSGELQPAKKFSSPTPAKSDFLLSAEISGDLLETEISTTLICSISNHFLKRWMILNLTLYLGSTLAQMDPYFILYRQDWKNILSLQ